nr:sigma factor-like helix-turn-helix DNA-binding protein [Thermoanaerobaculia bacterium]
EPDQLRRTLRREELERARRALDQLSGSQRRALALFCVQERSYREIALVLRVSVGRVKSLISEARQRLRQSLGEYQGSQSPRGEP